MSDLAILAAAWGRHFSLGDRELTAKKLLLI